MKLTILLTLAIAAVNALPVEQQVLQNSVETLDFETYDALPQIDTEALQSLITKAGLEEKANKLYSIAQRSEKEFGHPTRVIGSPGHWGTIGYILAELGKLKGYYKFTTQKFPALDSKVNSFSLLIDGTKPKSLLALGLTPPTKDLKPVHGPLVLVKNFGCSLDDFPRFTPGSIVLIERGECAFGVKSANAGLSGAQGAILYDKDPLHGTLGTPTGDEVASVSITTEDAQPYIDQLKSNSTTPIDVTLYVDSYVKTIKTINIVAETTFGDHDNVVFLGGHSDSVTEGPGINDDGSGSISLLEVAQQLTKFKTTNAVRFAWWAAEEEGLLGSDYYASSLSPEENSKIRLFMDYDMMASPNYEYQIYDANNVDHPDGSGTLKDLYIDWYTSHGLNYSLIVLDGRSDYVGFLDHGIPSGGIATGAEGVKTEEGVEKFGGKAGEWFDQCYHQLCDDLTNVDYEAWIINTKLIAHSVAVYADTFEGFPERTISEFGISSVKNDFKYHGSMLIV